MTNIEQFTQQLMLAHNISFEEAQLRAFTFYDNLAQDIPPVLNNGWISVDTIPMPINEQVLFCTNYGYRSIGTLENGGVSEMYFIGASYPIYDITHWQPLPNPPKG